MTSAVINGVRIHYLVSGEGPTVTLLHGYTGSHQDWARQIPLLAQKHRVVALDYRGHGKSEAPHDTSGYSIDPTADWHERMAKWIDAMNGLSVFTGKLKGLKEDEVANYAYDLSLLEQAKQRLAERRAGR